MIDFKEEKEKDMKTELHDFMVKLSVRIDEEDYDIGGYGLEFGTFGWQDCFIKVKNCMSLYQAILLVEGTYADHNKYRVNPEESYMMLPDLDLKIKLN